MGTKGTIEGVAYSMSLPHENTEQKVGATLTADDSGERGEVGDSLVVLIDDGSARAWR